MAKKHSTGRPARGDSVIRQAAAILADRLREPGVALSGRQAVRDYLKLHLAELPHEVFVALWVDSQNALIEVEEMFRGSLDQTMVYSREVVKSALRHNAAGVIFAHNHPSGVPRPSEADRALTARLTEALQLVEIRVLDHFIVARQVVLSMAESDEPSVSHAKLPEVAPAMPEAAMPHILPLPHWQTFDCDVALGRHDATRLYQAMKGMATLISLQSKNNLERDLNSFQPDDPDGAREVFSNRDIEGIDSALMALAGMVCDTFTDLHDKAAQPAGQQ